MEILRKLAVNLTLFPHILARNHKINMSRPAHSKRVIGVDKNIWVEFTKLANENKVVNLGQGFPDFAPPDFVKQALVTAVNGGPEMHQYTRGFGHPRLVKILAKFFSRLVKRTIDPMEEVLVTVGAYEALFCAFQTFVCEGDEVVIIEPFFDCYRPMVVMAGAKGVYVPLRPKNPDQVYCSGDWVLCPKELANAITDRTKAIVLNTPNNPLGKVFKLDELQMIADLCIKHNLICISDEVYEWITYDGRKHVKISTLPGMWDRTVTISSGGKTFSATGWKVGWVIGSSNLLRFMKTVHQNSVYHCATAVQEAVAIAFEKEYEVFGTPESYFQQFPAMLAEKKKKMASILKKVDLDPIIPEGGYYMMVDISFAHKEMTAPPSDDDISEFNDYRFGKWLIKEKGLVAIPVTAFYTPEHAKDFDKYLRLCFVKEDATLDAAEKVLRSWHNRSPIQDV